MQAVQVSQPPACHHRAYSKEHTPVSQKFPGLGEIAMGRRSLLAGVSAAVGAATLASAMATAQRRPAAGPAEVPVAELMTPGPLPDFVTGKEDAPVTVVEYASLTCGACGYFNTKVLPALKTKYIDTGKIRLVLRPFARDGLDAAAWMLAYCAGGDKSLLLVYALFERQQQWLVSGPNAVAELYKVAKQAGFTQESFDKCIKDSTALGQIEAIRTRATEKFGVEATPTFFINGKRLMGGSLADFDKALTPILPKS
jgi:protein-disulfide isomerase